MTGFPRGDTGMKPPPVPLAIVPTEALGARSFVAPNDLYEPYFTGSDVDQPDLVCGACGFVLVTSLPQSLLQEMILQCPVCLTLNEVTAR